MSKIGAAVPFPIQCREQGLPEPVAEYRFDATRKWRFDWFFYLPSARGGPRKVGLEIQGGIWNKGKHVRGKGYLADIEKLNEAQIAGYDVLYATPQDVETGKVFEWLRRLL